MSHRTDDRPNILLICTDHWAHRFCGPGGHPAIMTPTINQLARLGTWFVNAYSATPTCIPARRGLMTGMCSQSHGDRTFNEHLEMPDVPTMAQTFRDAGYQAQAVGKLHVYPQRDRIGFDEVLLNEEGRHHLGMTADDWEQHLADHGHAGAEYATGVCNNDYMVHPWHLPDELHSTNWTAREMSRVIRRRDPKRPAFWYMSFTAPHPPMNPTATYLEMYRDIPIDPPVIGDWAQDREAAPYMLRAHANRGFASEQALEHERDLAYRAFYALITHIDHQIRTVIGTLREEGILDNTAIAFTADHGDMLGDHHIWSKTVLFDQSAKVPMLLVPPVGHPANRPGHRDTRLAELRDWMPTLLEIAGIPVPDSVEGLSLIGDTTRDHLYGEHNEGATATRMVRRGDLKLIYYPAGNRFQLFDVSADPRELRDLADDPAHADARAELTDLLISNLYGSDLQWLQDGALVGLPEPDSLPQIGRGLVAQRGHRWM